MKKKLSPEHKRSIRVYTRITQDEMLLISDAAQKSNMSLSNFARYRLINKCNEIIPKLTAEEKIRLADMVQSKESIIEIGKRLKQLLDKKMDKRMLESILNSMLFRIEKSIKELNDKILKL